MNRILKFVNEIEARVARAVPIDMAKATVGTRMTLDGHDSEFRRSVFLAYDDRVGRQAANPKPVRTCQVCGRVVAASLAGIIEDHFALGQHRGEFWTTTVCIGSGHYAYEFKSDAIAPYINMLVQSLDLIESVTPISKVNSSSAVLNLEDEPSWRNREAQTQALQVEIARAQQRLENWSPAQ